MGIMIKLKYDPVAYVLKNGNLHHKLRVFLAVSREAGCQPLIEEIKSLQNPDGGWPWQLERGKPSRTMDTARTIQLLIRAGEDKGSRVIKGGVNFLKARQRADGGWLDEDPELKGLIPEEWDWTSTEYSGTGTTAEVINALLAAGHPRDARIERALEFLRRAQNEEGGWPTHIGPDYPYGTDIACMDDIVRAFINAGEPKRSHILKRAVDALLQHREGWKEPVGASSALCVFLTLGYPTEHPYIQELIQNLIEAQRPDGSWNWFGNLPSNPGQTAHCIEQLVRCGMEI